MVSTIDELEVATPVFEPYFIPITIGILAGLPSGLSRAVPNAMDGYSEIFSVPLLPEGADVVLLP